MPKSIPLLAITLIAVLSCVSPPPVIAETTAEDLRSADDHGYADPADDQSIFDYRLPDWSYRNASASFDFLARGRSLENEDSSDDRSQTDLSLNGSIAWKFESEAQDLRLLVSDSNQFRRSDQEFDSDLGPDLDRTTTVIQSRLVTSADWDRYVAGDFAVTTGVRANLSYDESEIDEADSQFDRIMVGRSAFLTAEAGVAWGRRRNVTPVVRAERVAERMLALGRSRPTRGQILRLADAFTQRGDFEIVYQRPDKFFWPPLLDELAGDRPFSPLEVLYLLEVFEESLPIRHQGYRVVTTAQINRSARSEDGSETQIGTSIGATWSHNLDLRNQIEFSATVDRFEIDDTGAPSDGDESTLTRYRLSAEHIWDVADRITIRSEATYDQLDNESEATGPTRDTTTKQTRVSVTGDFFVEDRWSVRPRLSWADQSIDRDALPGLEASTSESTDWSASVALVYHWDHLAD